MRYGHNGLWGDGHAFRFPSEAYWQKPFTWNRAAEKRGKPFLVFCASMGDVFEERPELGPHRDRLFEVIDATPWLTWQLLTKRPEFARDYWMDRFSGDYGSTFPPPNVWVGVSIENARFTWRADVLREIPCALRFLSCEPLLGSLFPAMPRASARRSEYGWTYKALELDGIGWVIGGGESGPKHRETKPEWARELRDAAKAEGVPYFWKQWGGFRPKSNGKTLDGREWCEIPEPFVPTTQLALA